MQLVTTTPPIYFTRLPDDANFPMHMIVGTLVRGVDKVFLRGAWTVDQWELWKNHEHFKNQPATLALDVREETPGIVMRVFAIVPLRLVPREQWPESVREEHAGEEWRGEQAIPRDAVMPLPLGNIVRYERAFEFGGDPHREAGSMLMKALRGKVVEPYEQGLGL